MLLNQKLADIKKIVNIVINFVFNVKSEKPFILTLAQ